MNEKPILFNGEMVRAILAGNKTQTRRPVAERILNKYYDYDDWVESVGKPDCPCSRTYEKEFFMEQSNPFGAAGGQLWVRETIDRTKDLGSYTDFSHYRADGEHTLADAWVWKNNYLPSIHCPRGLSRIQLGVKRVWVERVQDIDCWNATREGCADIRTLENNYDMKDCFSHLWNSIYGNKEGLSWNDNPWVWACEFEILS